jgi:hypothetical protein
MSPLRARMIEDMSLAGLAKGTQQIYVQAVRRLAAQPTTPNHLVSSALQLSLSTTRLSGGMTG